MQKSYLILLLLWTGNSVQAMCGPCVLNNVAGSPFAVGGNPSALAFSPGTIATCLAVTDAASGNLNYYSFDPTGCSISFQGAFPTLGTSPNGVAFAPNGLCLAVTNSGSGTILMFSVNLINCSLAQVGSPISTGGSHPMGVAFSPNNSCVAVGNSTSPSIAIFGTTPGDCNLTGPAIISLTGGNIVDVKFSPTTCADGHYLLAISQTSPSNSISLYDVDPTTCSATIIGTPVPTGGSGSSNLAFSPNGECLAVSNFSSDNVSVFTVNTNCTVNTPTLYGVGSHPLGVSFSANGECFAVANSSDNTMSVFNVGAGCVLSTPAIVYNANTDPQALAYSKADCLAVLNLSAGSITMFTSAVSQPSVSSTQVSCTGEVTINGGANPGNMITIFNGVTQIGGPVTVAADGSYTVTTSALANDSYTLTVKSTNFVDANCFADTSLPITISELETPVLTASRSSICSGQSTTLTASVTGGTPNYTYVFSDGHTVITSSPTLTYVVSPTTTTTYTVTVTDAQGCSHTSNSITISVDTIQASLTAEPPAICLGQSVNLIAEVTNGTPPFAYLFSDGFMIATNARIVTHLVTPTMTTLYTVTIADSQSCSSSSTATVTVHPNPSVTIIPEIQVVGFGRPIVLTAQVTSGTPPFSYAWTGPNGFTATGQTVTIPAAVGANAGIYTVLVTDSNGCTATAQATVIVTPILELPACSIVHTNQPVIFGSNDPFTAVTILINGVVVDTVLADALGNFSFIPAPLANGHYVVQASITIDGIAVLSNSVKLLVDTRTNLSALAQAISNKYCFFC